VPFTVELVPASAFNQSGLLVELPTPAGPLWEDKTKGKIKKLVSRMRIKGKDTKSNFVST